MASNSKNLGELLNTTTTVSPAFVSDQDNTSTGYFDLPNGTTAQRPTAASGMIRYNSTTNLAEYHDGVAWKSIDSPPLISSISPSTESDANANIVITGSNFSTTITSVIFVGNDGTQYTSPSVTRDSATQITATTPNTPLSVSNEPYDIKVTNSSGLNGTLADALDAGGVPAFASSAGSLGTLFDATRTVTGTTLNASATDPDGDTITYSVTTGSLPSGLSISSSTGMITGTASAVGSNTTTTFTVSAATASDTSTRQFSIAVQAPVITSYTSTGSGTFSVPSGVSAVNALVVAGGGGGGGDSPGSFAGGGGGGGLIYRPAFPVTPGGSVSYTVGSGGGNTSNGQDSVFGTLTAKGGGHGGRPGGPNNANPGGSGGGSGEGGNGSGGDGIQPQQPSDSGTYGFGNRGGHKQGPYGNSSAGGGGAGAVGGNPSGSHQGGPGGAGKQYAISGSQVYYAGGGGGGGYPQAGGNGGTAGNGGGTGGAGYQGANAQDATANRGGGGGGGAGGANGGNGGSGIVVVTY